MVKLKQWIQRRPRTVSLVGVTLAFTAGALAHAIVPGTSGGATRSALSFAGTLEGTAGPQNLVFTFHNGAATCDVSVGDVVANAVDHSFAVEIPLEDCPPAFSFDGADVTVDVTVGETQVVAGQFINPVPYAKYADRAGGAVGALADQITRPVATANGKQFSMFGYFRALSPTVHTGQITSSSLPPPNNTLVGTAATKAICEAAVGSPSAHMCTAAEMLLSVNLGIAMPPGVNAWYSTGLSDFSSGASTRDCVGWTSTDNAETGAAWYTGGPPSFRNPTGAPAAETGSCPGNTYPIACCD